MNKWMIYQRERFPLLQYVPMMLAFSFCAVSYSMHLSNPDALLQDISTQQYLTAFLSTIFFFLLMRIADEHKDYEEDCLYRPYRPVQRGLIRLSELRNCGILLLVVQVALALWLDPRLLWPLGLAYLWLTLMTVEFFVPQWLKTRHTLYLLSHMAIMPLIDLYATAVEWIPRNGAFSFGIAVFMISSYCDGTVVEVGRKLRAPEHEEYGVDTYTQIWGARRAMAVWLGCVTISMVSTIAAGFQVQAGWEIAAALGILYCYAIWISLRFAKDPSAQNAKVFTIFPGLWMMVMYLLLGVIPFFK